MTPSSFAPDNPMRAVLLTDESPHAFDLLSELQRHFSRVEYVSSSEHRGFDEATIDVVVFPESYGTSLADRATATFGVGNPIFILVAGELSKELISECETTGVHFVLDGYDDPRAGLVFALAAGLIKEKRTKDAQLRFVIEASHACGLRYAETDLTDELRVTYASEVRPSRTRRPGQMLVGRSGAAMMAPEARAQTLQMLRADVEHARRTGEAPAGRMGDTPFLNADGTIDYRRMYTRILMGSDGAPRAIAGYSSDISDLKRTEAALRRSEADYRRLFESANDAIIIFRPSDERILEVNKPACTLYGVSRENFIGSSLLDYSIEPIVGRQRVEQLLVSGEMATFRTRHRRSDATIMNVEVSASVFEYRGEQAIVSFNRDLTELFEAEQSIRLHKERLDRAATMETIGRITSGVAHDFNNLLSIVTTCSSLLEETLEDSRALAINADISEAAQRGATLVRQLMVGASDREPRPRTLELETVVMDMHRLLRYLATDSIGVELDLEEQPEAILADPMQVEQILLNLVANARDAIGAHGTIRIMTRKRRWAGGTAIELQVDDDGCGMTDETRERALEPFFSTKGNDGNGVGLALVASIVKELGGELTIKSAFGKGTSVVIALPEHTSVHLDSSPAQSS